MVSKKIVGSVFVEHEIVFDLVHKRIISDECFRKYDFLNFMQLRVSNDKMLSFWSIP